MKILDVTPMLTVAAMGPALAFYRDVLGFACLVETEGLVCLGLDGSEVMLALPNAHLPFDKPTMTGSIYFNVEGVDAWWGRLRERCAVVYPVEDFEYGMREFAIRDNSGYLLQFGQRLGG
jgi:uncharacterized glyoxalase superfamily protein PhnB